MIKLIYLFCKNILVNKKNKRYKNMKTLKIEYLRGLEDGILLLSQYLYDNLDRKNIVSKEYLFENIDEIVEKLLTSIYEQKIYILKQELILTD